MLPSQTPTEAPSISPTEKPTTAPTDLPTKLPSAAPTIAPTFLPATPTPSNDPSPAPTLAPTALPTEKKECAIDIELFCETTDRSDCSDILPPSLCPDVIHMITLRYTADSCDGTDPSINCLDFDASDASKALLMCVDGNGNSLDVKPDGLFEKNDLLTISTSAVGALTEGISCALFDARGVMLQSYELLQDGNSDIIHGQTVGAFQVIACGAEQSCLVDFLYEIAIYNDASDSAVLSDVTLVSMDGSKDVMQEMIEQVIPPNDSLTGIYRADINICSTESLQMGLLVEVMTTDGKITCIDAATHAFVTKQPEKVISKDPLPAVESGGPKSAPAPTESPMKVLTEKPSSSPIRIPTLPPSTNPTAFPYAAPTASPIKTASATPTGNPTFSPTSNPTVSPSVTPTERQTRSPTDTPSASPIENPTVSPTTNPTVSPSIAPTTAPQCPAVAEISCVTPGGTKCEDLQGVSETKCQCPDCPQEVRFRYTAAKCSPDIHFSLCQDMNEDVLPTSVRIEITDTAMSTTYFDQLVDFGGDAVAFAEGMCVEEVLAVFVNDPDTGALLQVLEVSLGCSSSSGTDLLSQFGSVEFSGYTCQSGIVRNCYGTIDWSFVAKSALNAAQQINRFDLVFNGETMNLLDAANSAVVGGSNPEFRQQVQTGLQFCSQTFFDIALILEAAEPSGESCTSETSLSFAVVAGEIMTQPNNKNNKGPGSDAQGKKEEASSPVDGTEIDSSTPTAEASSCGLAANIECVLDDGTPCDKVVPPQDAVCHGKGGLSSLEFSYQNVYCSGAKNSQSQTWLCTDSSALYEGKVGIACTSVLDEQELKVSPSTVGPGATFKVASLDPELMLPSAIMCVLKGPGNRILQKNLLDASGVEEIHLGDQFGALQVEACGDVSCNEQFTYQMSIRNEGRKQMLITETNFVFNGSGGNPLAVERNGLDPGDERALDVTVEVDVCRGRAYEAAVEVSVALASGAFCNNRDATRLELPHLWD